MPEATTS